MNGDNLDVTPEELDLLSARERVIVSGRCPNGCGELKPLIGWGQRCPGCEFTTTLNQAVE